MTGRNGILRALRLLFVIAFVGTLPTTGGWITLYVLGGMTLLAGLGCCLTSCLCDPCGDCDCDCSGCTDCGCGDCDCDPGCSDCDCDCDCDCGECLEMAPDEARVAAAAAPLFLPMGRRLSIQGFAHHPPGPAYEQDTYNLRGARLCIGCFTTYPVFLAASAWLALAPPGGAWSAWLLGGLGLAAVQGVSAAGLARLRWQKIAVKTSLGLGLAAAVHGVLISPWPLLGQQAALLGMLVLAGASAIPRALRMRAHGDSCRHTRVR